MVQDIISLYIIVRHAANVVTSPNSSENEAARALIRHQTELGEEAAVYTLEHRIPANNMLSLLIRPPPESRLCNLFGRLVLLCRLRGVSKSRPSSVNPPPDYGGVFGIFG